MKKANLVIIDPQNDFTTLTGSLPVDGAPEDMSRIASLIYFLKGLNEIIVTLDAHQYNHIAHRYFWINEQRVMPNAYDLITAEDVRTGKWIPACPDVDNLKVMTHFEIMPELRIWPTHCVMGTDGFAINVLLQNALKDWVNVTKKSVKYFLKGQDIHSEQFSAIQPVLTKHNIIDNTLVADAFAGKPDFILITGEALNFCVKATMEDFFKVTDREGVSVSNVIIVEDCCSNVKGYEQLGEDFLTFAESKGAKVMKMKAVLEMLLK